MLLVRLHLADFYWGDVSLSNVLFRRSAGGFAAYLVDAETGELKDSLSTNMREYDVTVGCENVFAELLDLQASGQLDAEVDASRSSRWSRTRYHALWDELTGEEEFPAAEMWRIEQRIERLNDLGFDVDELDIVTDFDGDPVRIQPKVVELGHHRRELQGLTGLNVEDAQARRMLNDIAAFTAHYDLGREDRALVANRWLTQIYEPIMAMVPPEARGKLEPAEIFHEILVHRWYLSERAGAEVDIFDAARDYIDTVLAKRPEEAVATPGGPARRAAPDATSSAEQVAPDHHPLDLVGALEDLGHLGVAEEPLDGVLARVAVAAEHLHGVGRHPHRGVGGGQLGDAGLAGERPAGVLEPRRVEVRRPGPLHLGRHVGEQELQPLELADRLAELLALPGVRHGVGERGLRDAGGDRGDAEPAGVEGRERDPHAVALVADALRGRDPGALEDHLGRDVAGQAHLLLGGAEATSRRCRRGR